MEARQAHRRLGSWTVVLIAHGTVNHVDELPDFVKEIRRGRPAPPELLDELRHRYDTVGGSPLLEWTNKQASALEQELGLTCRVAMRLWSPRIEHVVADLGPTDPVCLVPLAPFSVPIYADAARRSLAKLATPPPLTEVEPWGQEPELLDAWTDSVRAAAGQWLQAHDTALILTAHSLPRFIIEKGDPYAKQFEAAASAVKERLGVSGNVAYQSQGASGAEWLGPTLEETMQQAKAAGARRVVVAPIGFLAEHIETLYDLDHEAKAQAQQLGLGFQRVPTLNDHPGLVSAMANVARRAMAQAMKATSA